MESVGNVSSKVLFQRLSEEWTIEKTYTGHVVLARYCESWNIPMIFSSLYLLMVFQGKNYMAAKASYSIRRPMLVWSTLLAIFSILGAFRCSIIVFGLLRDGDMQQLICNQAFYTGPITKFWAALFTYSKFIEYGDTAFILLRKQNLIFLHWYHHLTVALFSWLMYGGRYAGGSLFMPLNYVVHSFMYTYYAVRAAGIKTPRFVSIFITSLQIVQMVFGCLIMAAVVTWRNDKSCHTSPMHQLSGTVMYGSYLLLFMHFFYNNYLRKKKSEKSTETTSNISSVLRPQKEISAHTLRKRKI